MPKVDDILTVRNTLLQSPDLRRIADLEQQLKGQSNLSEEASQSLVALLQVAVCSTSLFFNSPPTTLRPSYSCLASPSPLIMHSQSLLIIDLCCCARLHATIWVD